MRKQVFRIESDGFNGAWYPASVQSYRGLIIMLGDSSEDRMAKTGAKWLNEQGIHVMAMSPDKKDYGHHNYPLERFRGNAWRNTWKIRLNPENHSKGIAFVYDTCPLNDFARRHGYIDFLPKLCYIDQITCSAAHGKLIRHKTLADGDGECNYWILGDKTSEALSDVGSK